MMIRCLPYTPGFCKRAGLAILLCTFISISASAGTLRGDSLAVAGKYRKLIEAENNHDIAAVKGMLYDSPGTMLVAKTKTKEEGGWAGFFGKEIVGEHLEAIVTGGTFKINPDYLKQKIAFLKADVAELYVPLTIAVSYAGQNPIAKPFLMIVMWIKSGADWKIQSDIVIPVPQS